MIFAVLTQALRKTFGIFLCTHIARRLPILNLSIVTCDVTFAGELTHELYSFVLAACTSPIQVDRYIQNPYLAVLYSDRLKF
jgi:hypothetical protein